MKRWVEREIRLSAGSFFFREPFTGVAHWEGEGGRDPAICRGLSGRVSAGLTGFTGNRLVGRSAVVPNKHQFAVGKGACRDMNARQGKG